MASMVRFCWEPTPGSQTDRHLPSVSSCGRSSRGTLWVSSRRTLIPFRRAPPPWPNHLPKAQSPTVITLGVRISTHELGGDTQAFSPQQPQRRAYYCRATWALFHCSRVFLIMEMISSSFTFTHWGAGGIRRCTHFLAAQELERACCNSLFIFEQRDFWLLGLPMMGCERARHLPVSQTVRVGCPLGTREPQHPSSGLPGPFPISRQP